MRASITCSLLRSWPALLLCALLASYGCGASDARQDCEPRSPGEIDGEGEVYQWIVDSVRMPASSAEAGELALDLDGDRQGRPDNALGMILSLVFSQLDVDLNGVTAAMIADARILHLIELRATSLDTAQGVAARLFLGQDTDGDPTDNFSGQEIFGVEAGPLTRPMSGVIEDGRVDTQLGLVPLRIALPGSDEPFTLELQSARIVAQVSDDALSGVLAGVISRDELRNELLPIAYVQISFVVARDCATGSCVAETSGADFVDLFDTDDDAVVSYLEFSESSLMRSLSAPDLDVFDGELTNNPLCDGVKESLSVGVGFTAVRAGFDAPAG